MQMNIEYEKTGLGKLERGHLVMAAQQILTELTVGDEVEGYTPAEVTISGVHGRPSNTVDVKNHWHHVGFVNYRQGDEDEVWFDAKALGGGYYYFLETNRS